MNKIKIEEYNRNNKNTIEPGINQETGFKMEELIPIVAKLADKYVSSESSSISYEMAEHFMSTVIFTICEQSALDSEATAIAKNRTARQAYEEGYDKLVEKVKKAMEEFNQLTNYFDSYNNHCLEDTVIKGMPEFFKWYDVRFDPQNTMLTLDYPVLQDLSLYEGIHRIERYLHCIVLEQMFLSKFDRNRILEILSEYDTGYHLMIDNLCEVVFQDVLFHLLLEKPMQERFAKKDKNQIMSHVKNKIKSQSKSQMDNLSEQETKLKIRMRIHQLAETFILNYYDGNENLLHYLLPAADGIAARVIG